MISHSENMLYAVSITSHVERIKARVCDTKNIDYSSFDKLSESIKTAKDMYKIIFFRRNPDIIVGYLKKKQSKKIWNKYHQISFKKNVQKSYPNPPQYEFDYQLTPQELKMLNDKYPKGFKSGHWIYDNFNNTIYVIEVNRPEFSEDEVIKNCYDINEIRKGLWFEWCIYNNAKESYKFRNCMHYKSDKYLNLENGKCKYGYGQYVNISPHIFFETENDFIEWMGNAYNEFLMDMLNSQE